MFEITYFLVTRKKNREFYNDIRRLKNIVDFVLLNLMLQMLLQYSTRQLERDT